MYRVAGREACDVGDSYTGLRPSPQYRPARAAKQATIGGAGTIRQVMRALIG
jgi:hypothetical protein